MTIRSFAALLFICAVTGTASAGVHDGLLNYWNLDGNFEDTAGALAGNTSTTVDNGTQPNASVSFAASPTGVGEYAVFNGDDEAFVEVPDSADIVAAGESLSISAWFQVNNFDQSWQALIAHGESTDYRIARRSGANVMAYAGGAGDIPGDDSGPDVNDGEWHHVVSVSPFGEPAQLWVDGALVATGDATSLTDNASGRLMIGGNPDTSGDGFRTWDGGIDDIGMWDRALTQSEIELIALSGTQGIPLAEVPEPATGLMAIFALAGIAQLRRRRG